MKHIGLALIVVCVMSPLSIAKDVTLSWDPSPTPTVAGYVINVLSTLWTNSIEQEVDVGNVLTHKILNLEDTSEEWFCVKAYDSFGNKSVCSNVVKSPAVEIQEEVLPQLDLKVDVEILK